MAKKKFVVACPIHGQEGGSPFRWEGKMVAVPEPTSRGKGKNTKCPLCKRNES